MAYGRILGGQVRRWVLIFSSAFTAFNPFSQSVRQSVTISLWEVLSLRCQVWSLPPVRGRTISALWLRAASISSRETHRLIGPTSTILPSPDTSVRHPFYAVSAAFAGVSGASPALSALSLRPMPRYSAFDTLPARRYAPPSLMSPPLSIHVSPLLASTFGRLRQISLWV
ncbi:hypothetical protein EDB84DRAFT_1559275 [Lactarius hengduanensis]|nr:hypothetical protein EDB84DRAFT_1559275 [Lactarius hengduanensis]